MLHFSLKLAVLVGCFPGALCWSLDLPVPSYMVAGRVLDRTFYNIERFDNQPQVKSGFVQYVDVVSFPAEIDPAIFERIKALYKPATHASGPMTPITAAVVLFDVEKRAILLIGLYDDPRVTIARVREVDSNCYQGARDAEFGCTIDDRQTWAYFRTFFRDHQRPPPDLSKWMSDRKKAGAVKGRGGGK